jgi:hypothetical protein
MTTSGTGDVALVGTYSLRRDSVGCQKWPKREKVTVLLPHLKNVADCLELAWASVPE